MCRSYITIKIDFIQMLAKTKILNKANIIYLTKKEIDN